MLPAIIAADAAGILMIVFGILFRLGKCAKIAGAFMPKQARLDPEKLLRFTGIAAILFGGLLLVAGALLYLYDIAVLDDVTGAYIALIAAAVTVVAAQAYELNSKRFRK